jgi:hypothetical protein
MRKKMDTGIIPKKCPACGQSLRVCRLQCGTCGTEVQGSFHMDRFSKLSEEQLLFMEIFLKSRGNLKDLCSIIGVSYPTARNRLDQLIDALDFESKAEVSERRLDILEQIKEGKLSPEEAVKLLEKRE